jgi:ParB/RepB/Spo0J family partition protein
MKLDFIPMDKLSIAATNMRGKGKDADVSDLLPSVRARGVLVPLLVRPNCAEGHFEIVAGRRRFTAVNAVAREGGAVKPLPCAILDEGDDVDALEASMLENLARVQPDEVRQWEAFVELVKSGRSVDEVADTFGFEPSAVKRILALGNLLPRIRTLYRGGQIDVNTVRHLTLASKSQQKAWLALFDDEAAYCPTGHQLKAWLFGGSAIAVTHALFDIDMFKGGIVADLFGEDRFFADSDAFWSAQMDAIGARKADYLNAGWSGVEIMPRGEWFRSWDHVHAGKRSCWFVFFAPTALTRSTSLRFMHPTYLRSSLSSRAGFLRRNGWLRSPMLPGLAFMAERCLRAGWVRWRPRTCFQPSLALTGAPNYSGRCCSPRKSWRSRWTTPNSRSLFPPGQGWGSIWMRTRSRS